MNLAAPELFVERRAKLHAAEQAALDCLTFCLSRRRLAAVPLPIPADKWVENPLGFDYDIKELPDLVPGRFIAAGLAEPDSKTIHINASIAHDAEAVRWVTAHEIGHHLLLHTTTRSGYEPLDFTDGAFRYKNLWERQADRFAAAFLMPQAVLIQVFCHICERRGWNSGDTLRELTTDTHRATSLWIDVFLMELSKTFGVKMPGVFYRLSELRLFDGAPLLLPIHARRLGLLVPS